MPISDLQKLPESNNFYASFKDIDKTTIKAVFEKNNWSCRKASWTDYELTNDWSELILEGKDNEPLLNGVVIINNNNLEILDKIFAGLEGYFLYEFYDEHKNLILKKKNDS